MPVPPGPGHVRRYTAAARDKTPPAPMAAELLSATILLILVIDPFGNVPLVAAALAAIPAERRFGSCCANA